MNVVFTPNIVNSEGAQGSDAIAEQLLHLHDFNLALYLLLCLQN